MRCCAICGRNIPDNVTGEFALFLPAGGISEKQVLVEITTGQFGATGFEPHHICVFCAYEALDAAKAEVAKLMWATSCEQEMDEGEG